MPLLDARGITVTFGGLRAVNDVDLKVESGTIVGLIGPNGAGKTTLIDALTGFVPSAGTVRLADEPVEHLPVHRRARKGLARTWQSIELFDDLTVRQNVQVAAERGGLREFVADLFHPGRRRASDDRVDAVLADLGLSDVGDRPSTALSHGRRKVVGVARALVSGARLLLMDEPAAGLDTHESARFGTTLRGIVTDDIGILLIDHDMALVLGICDYIYVLEFGSIIAEGTPDEIRTNERVIAAYLGESARADVEAAKQALAEVDR